LVAVSHVTTVFPVPAEPFAGVSFAPLNDAVKTCTVSLQPEIDPTGMQLFGVFPFTCVLRSVTDPRAAPNGEMFAIPPPETAAVFPVTLPLFIVSVGVGDVTPGIGTPCRLMLPMPAPIAALFPVRATLLSVAVAWLRRPPPVPPSASLSVRRVLFISSVPPFEMPPPPVSSPPVALLPLITPLLIVVTLPGPPPLPLPAAMPPPPEAVLSLTVLLLRVRTPATLRMPPPPMPLDGTVFEVTRLLLRISVAPGPGPIVPLAIPPPAPEAWLPVTVLLLSTSVPPRLRMPPPKPAGPPPETFPPVTVRPFTRRLPPAEPSIVMIRKLLLEPAIVAPLPLIVIAVVITGSPVVPSPATVVPDVIEYVQPDARLITPPAAFALAAAATSPAPPPPDPEQGTFAKPTAWAAPPPNAAATAHARTTA